MQSADCRWYPNLLHAHPTYSAMRHGALAITTILLEACSSTPCHGRKLLAANMHTTALADRDNTRARQQIQPCTLATGGGVPVTAGNAPSRPCSAGRSSMSCTPVGAP